MVQRLVLGSLVGMAVCTNLLGTSTRTLVLLFAPLLVFMVLWRLRPISILTVLAMTPCLGCPPNAAITFIL